jgi:hypothetical protein
MGTGRSYHGACSHGGQLYVVGGLNYNPLASGERYDPELKTWAAIAPMPLPRSHFSICSMGEFIYDAGGCGASNGHKYDPSHNTWSPIAPLGTRRDGHCLCAMDGFMYAVGGFGDGCTLMSVERYDPKTDIWTQVAALNVCRSYACCVVLDGRLHVLGGRNMQFPMGLRETERYDAAANVWEVVPAMELRSARFMVGGCSTLVQMNLFDKLLLERKAGGRR